MRVWRAATVSVLLLLGASQFAGAGLMYAKAWLAPRLIEAVYERAPPGTIPEKPWSWADTRPLARLTLATLDAQRIVLDGDSGHVLAFGPGMASGSRPGDAGLVMISGHRDTHFRILKDLQPGAEVSLEYLGSRFDYEITRAVIADAREGQIEGPLPGKGLLLVTCYPFDAILPGGPLRYVLVARQLKPAHSSPTVIMPFK